jgi:hypothetical protein
MARQTLTLWLDGHPTLDEYVTALTHWQELIELSSTNASITWELDGLEISSALTTALGVSDDEQALLESTAQMIDIGVQLRDTGVARDRKFAKAARGLMSVLNGRIPSLRLENERNDVTIERNPVTSRKEVAVANLDENDVAVFGAVEGRIQTVSNRGSLRFSLYDLAFDKQVSCYLDANDEDMLRNAWGRIAVVEGKVKRDPKTSRPTTVRHVTSIVVLAEPVPNAWREAQGALAGIGNGEPTETTVRRLRDAT